MKIMIISDIHGSSLFLKKALNIYKNEYCEKLLILGDILYHGPRNDLPSGYAPKEVIELLNPLKDEIVAVQGNCDAEVDQMVLDFDCSIKDRIIDLDGLKVFMTHGHHHNIEKLNTEEKFDILLHGHTHIPTISKQDNYYYLNPGSTSIPKNSSKNSLIIYENHLFDFRDLDNISYQQITL